MAELQAKLCLLKLKIGCMCKIPFHKFSHICYSCSMGTGGLPDMYHIPVLGIIHGRKVCKLIHGFRSIREYFLVYFVIICPWYKIF